MPTIRLLTLMLFACRTPMEKTTEIDADGDGHPESEDCDDQNPAAHPDQTEDCDGIDNNCNGEVDEGLTRDFYADIDGDGYGDGHLPAHGCDPPPGFITTGSDCDDDNAQIHPGANEYCDEIDQDCDGETYDAESIDASTWHADTDADGYGDANDTQSACSQPEGHIADDSDCDDSNATVFPGSHAFETPFDGIDQDCDGEDLCQDLNCDGWPDLILPSYESDLNYMPDSFVYFGGASGYSDGNRMALPTNNARSATTGDFNGDGYIDILFGAYYDEDHQTLSRVYYGGPAGYSVDQSDDLPGFGIHRVRAADLNGDGLDDAVLVSQFNGVDYATEAQIYWGDLNGLSANWVTPLQTSGSRDVALVDLDGDGSKDIYLPAFWGTFETHIYWGSANGIFDADNRTTVINGLSEKASVADIDQDGQLDLLLPSDGGIDQIRYGDGRDYSNAISLESDNAIEMAAADLDKDGDIDIVICQNQTDIGAVYNPDSLIWWNDSGFSSGAVSTLDGHSCHDVLIDDINADEWLDIILVNRREGSEFEMDYLAPTLVYFGSESGYSIDNRLELPGNAANEGALGDLDGDGFKDLVLNGYTDGLTYAVDSHIYWGGTDGFDPLRVTALPGFGVRSEIQIVGAFTAP